MLFGAQYFLSNTALESEVGVSRPDTPYSEEGPNDRQELDQVGLRPNPGSSSEAANKRAPVALTKRESEPVNIRDLPDKTILAALVRNQLENMKYAVEALDRSARCRRYTRHPKAREQRLLDVESDPQTVDMLILLWERRDAECPGLDPNLRQVALDWLLVAADGGNMEAQKLYYQHGRESISTWLRQPERTADFVARVRRYVEPLVVNPQPDTLDFLFSIFRDGLVYPRDYPASAVYRFASYYNQGLSPTEIDQRRLAWGRNLTDAQIDRAEQAGYALYLECCGP